MLTAVSRPLVRAWQRYEHALHSRPILTQSLTSAALWGLGDVFSQRLDGPKHFDWRRTAWTAVFGGAMVGPVGHRWYLALDKLVAKQFQRGTVSFIAAKVAADELTFGPLHVASFFTFMTLAQGGTWEDAKAKLRRDFLSAYLAELTVWPAFQAWNFAKIPVRHQLLVVNIACLADATFLCWVKSQENWLARIGLAKASYEK